jgi:predicted hotdog family 3-hydroxylacyl-ACP dehydratase
MNLLERVVSWDASSLAAEATSHRMPAHPLRRAGQLPITAGIEYGAQAAAAHGALVGATGAGLLASVRAVRFFAERLDDITTALDVRAEQLGGGAGGVLYRFEVAAQGRTLVDGRVTIAFAR